MRAGGKTLTLLGAPRTYLILNSLFEGTRGQLELRRDAGSPAQSTLRGHLGLLESVGAIEKHRRDSFPGRLEYDLTEAGRELFAVSASLGRWLAGAPRGPIELGSSPAKAAIKGLVDGWSAMVLTALASGPLSLTELDKRIATVSYPTIERCLETMRLAEQINVGSRSSRGRPYAITAWLRHGLAPLALAARWEHRRRPDGVDSICHDDVDDAILLGGPLFELSSQSSGICQLAVRLPDRAKRSRPLGFLEVEGGAIAFAAARPESNPDAWASGTTDTWFATVIDAETQGLRLSGDRELAAEIFTSVHRALFAGPVNRAAPESGLY